jgi:Skp family chaperone for outer membrane proteins
MELGSPEHKAQVCQDLIKTYYENIWKDEMYLIQLEEVKGDKRKEIAAIDLKIENKEFKTKTEGEKAKFVAERELAQIENEIKKISEQVTALWPARIRLVNEYLEKK